MARYDITHSCGHEETDKASGLPELSGSPKQIAWAADIRSKTLGSNLQDILQDTLSRKCGGARLEM